VVELNLIWALDMVDFKAHHATRNHGLFNWKTKPKTNHFDIWTSQFEHVQLD
jgi:hypothetical protein